MDSGSIMINELGLQTIDSEFDSLKIPLPRSLVPN